MKSLKFAPDLVPLVKNGSKTSTFRLFDDKNLQVGEIVEFIQRPELTVFAKAEIVEVTKKPFGNMTKKDMEGHEKYSSKKEMYDTYTSYYSKKVNDDTEITIYRFKLL